MQDSHPTVAIIIPCFNRWPHIQEAIESVLAQTWSNTQCIVVDDASTDDSFMRIEEQYGADPRVKTHQLASNLGQSAARNRGAEICDTDYIGFLDSDDLLIDTAVASRMRLAENNPMFEGIIFGDKVDEASKLSLLPGKKHHSAPLTLQEYIMNRGWLCSDSFIMKRGSFLKSQGFNESLRKKEDVEFFLRALASHGKALYAAGPCCIVREIDTQRARHDHARIIEQGELFVSAISENETLSTKLTHDQLQQLIESNTRSILHSLYKSRRYKEFRSKLKADVKMRKIKINLKLIRRFITSYLL